MTSQLTAKGGVVWIPAERPEPEELAQIVREAELKTMDAEFVAQDRQRPAVITREGYTLILITVPVFDQGARVTSGAALYLIARGERLTTVQYEPIAALAKLKAALEESPEKRDEYFGSNALELALFLIGEMYESAGRKLKRLAKQIDIAEDAIFHGNERKMVEEVAVLTRDVMDFRKIIRSQRQLFTLPPAHFEATAQEQWRRLGVQVLKLWEMLESLYESTGELSNTNFRLLQHKENELLRLLTYYSIAAIPVYIIISPITQRMSDPSPWYKAAFFGIVTVLIATLLLIFWRFRRKKVL